MRQVSQRIRFLKKFVSINDAYSGASPCDLTLKNIPNCTNDNGCEISQTRYSRYKALCYHKKHVGHAKLKTEINKLNKLSLYADINLDFCQDMKILR